MCHLQQGKIQNGDTEWEISHTVLQQLALSLLSPQNN